MNKQDILNAFREVLNKAKTFDEMQANAEEFILTTLTEFERETKKEVFKTCGCAKCRSWLTFETLSVELEKEKRT